jgi:hypothetical protein
MVEHCGSPTTASAPLTPNRLSVVPSTKWELERETGLEPATFSLEGRGRLAQWGPSWKAEHFVSSYRVAQRGAEPRSSGEVRRRSRADGRTGQLEGRCLRAPQREFGRPESTQGRTNRPNGPPNRPNVLVHIRDVSPFIDSTVGGRSQGLANQEDRRRAAPGAGRTPVTEMQRPRGRYRVDAMRPSRSVQKSALLPSSAFKNEGFSSSDRQRT